MNWKRSALYGAALLGTAFAIGILHGLLVPLTINAIALRRVIIAEEAISFALSSAIFAHLAYCCAKRPFANAFVALATYTTGSAAIGLLAAIWLPPPPMLLVAIDLVSVFAALGAGTLIGRSLRPHPSTA